MKKWIIGLMTGMVLLQLCFPPAMAENQENDYLAVVETYRQALHECWGWGTLTEHGLEEDLHEYFLRPESRPAWAITEMHGEQVLLIGDTRDEPGQFRALYVRADGEIRKVLVGWERNRWYLRQDGQLRNEGSSSAFESTYSIGRMENGRFVERTDLEYTAYNDKPAWTLKENGELSVLTDEEAVRRIESWAGSDQTIAWQRFYETRKAVVTADKGAVGRRTADPKGERTGRLPVGSLVLADETAGDFSYVRFHRDGNVWWGYVNASAIRELDETAETAFGIISKNGKTDGKTKINIRARASKKSPVIDQWTTGAYAMVYGHSNGWYEVEWNGCHGFVMEEFLTLSPLP